MNASILKRTLVLAAVVAVPWIGWSWWSSHREAAERETLAAEIREEMEARRRQPPQESAGLADLTEPYRAALLGVGSFQVSQAVHNSLFRTERWNQVPPEVTALLAARGAPLDAFAAAVANLPPGRMVLSQNEWVQLSGISTFLRARGRAQVTTGDLGGLLATLGLLRRLSADVEASTREDIAGWPGNLALGMERTALELLALLVFHPALGEREAAEALAVANGRWAVNGARIHVSTWALEQNDRLCLELLADDALENMKARNLVDDPTGLERIGDILQGRTRQERTGPRRPPRAAAVRRMREVAARQRAAFENRDAEAVRLAGPLDLETWEDLGGGWVAGGVSGYLQMARGRWSLEARLAVLRAAFALRLHELRGGAAPASLAELVPGILPSVPTDPWTREPVRFTPRPNGWILEAGHPDATFTTPGGWSEMQSPYRLVK